MLTVRPRRITAEKFLRLRDHDQPMELVRGRIETMMMPAPRHGFYCVRAAVIAHEYASKHKAGRVISNDSGVITERDPDTVRGADVAFYSYKRVAKGKMPKGYFPAPPEVIFEVRSPTDRMGRILKKMGEYLAVGVLAVCLIDPDRETITVFEEELPPRILRKSATLELPKILPGFRVPVARFFDED